MSIYMGIDPGKKGGIAIIRPDGSYNTEPLTELNLRQAALIFGENTKAVVESVHAMPGQGVTSMFNFGKGFGYILGVLETCGVTYELVPPQKWKKEFSIGQDKSQSITVCKRLFPGVNLKATERCRNEHDGMAEALLLAEFARRHMK